MAGPRAFGSAALAFSGTTTWVLRETLANSAREAAIAPAEWVVVSATSRTPRSARMSQAETTTHSAIAPAEWVVVSAWLIRADRGVREVAPSARRRAAATPLAVLA